MAKTPGATFHKHTRIQSEIELFFNFCISPPITKTIFCSNCSSLYTSPCHNQQLIQHNHTFDFRKPELELAISRCQRTRTNSVSQIQVEMIFIATRSRSSLIGLMKHIANIPSFKHGHWWSEKWPGFYERDVDRQGRIECAWVGRVLIIFWWWRHSQLCGDVVDFAIACVTPLMTSQLISQHLI